MSATRTEQPAPARAEDEPPGGRWSRVTQLPGRWQERVDRLRHRLSWFDHLARAGGRYQRTQGDLMAAGVTYFVFLGLVPVLLLVASVIGLVLAGNALLQQELYSAIRNSFPGPTGVEIVRELRGAVGSAGVVGIIALAGFLYAGLRAMDKLRLGMERIWKGRLDEPEFLRDNLQDLMALVALGAMGLLSLGFTGVVTQATGWLTGLLGIQDASILAFLTTALGLALALVTDVVVFLWLLKVVPSTAHPLRRLLPGALFGAAGFEVMKLLGSLYLSLISGSVTASAFGGAVGILVWINLVCRFAFFTAAWTATLPQVQGDAHVVTERTEPVVPPAHEPTVRPGTPPGPPGDGRRAWRRRSPRP
ncbi:YihY/virulence factor BrkB family protein [Geodermatophilus sp. DF01-2]|uniref:YihY/virulence factor BrkB family protein n=1 Tax=Geodermatophilus sp. DF01-2 TaxID=2559610 RepID=UPI0010742C44|nr:YihY/virulence factor BrkB family protein [Geodermatophilus sp. DF01_2]TFV59001.1 YihY/virulence factor BrkB family protein [Geodermatophilus sp. DF01_2]